MIAKFDILWIYVLYWLFLRHRKLSIIVIICFQIFKHCLNGSIVKIPVSTPAPWQLLWFPALNFNAARYLAVVYLRLTFKYSQCTFYPFLQINTSQFFCPFTYSLPIILQIVSLQIVHISKCNFSSIIIDVQPQITNSLYFTINKWSKTNQSNSISNMTYSTSPLHLHTYKHTHIAYANDFCSISFWKLIWKLFIKMIPIATAFLLMQTIKSDTLATIFDPQHPLESQCTLVLSYFLKYTVKYCGCKISDL